MATKTKFKTPFNYYGGKSIWLNQIYPLFPPIDSYLCFVDVFCGSGTVTINKPPSKIETINDLNSEITNFFKVLRENTDEFLTAIELTPYSREEFYHAVENNKPVKPIEKARLFFTRVNQSFGGTGDGSRPGWSYCKTEFKRYTSASVSKWLSKIDNLGPIINRLKHCQIENLDFRELIKKYDNEQTFFYCDPPYLPETRTSMNHYRIEMSIDDHIELSAALTQGHGKFMISHYDCATYDDLYKDCFKRKLATKKNGFGTAKTEFVWMNYDPDKIHGQLTIEPIEKEESN